MTPGILHIIRLGQTRDKYDRLVADYQITYDVPTGDSFHRTVRGEEALKEFLQEVVVPANELDRALGALRRHGNATIPNVSISLQETAPLGMVQDPSEV
jgi:hypothetical protein